MILVRKARHRLSVARYFGEKTSISSFVCRTLIKNTVLSLVIMCSTKFGPVMTVLPSIFQPYIKPTILISVLAPLSDWYSLGYVESWNGRLSG
jgi:hypothetical protein